MRFGLDIHGVIDTNPKFFSALSKSAIRLGHDIHIITGSMLTKSKIDKLKSYGMNWSYLFSISDYHKSLGTPMTFSDPNNPWITNDLWDKTKAEYCKDNKIDFHVDDTSRYGEFFETAFGLYDHVNRRIDWHKSIEDHGVILTKCPEDSLKNIIRVIESLKYPKKNYFC